MPRRTRGRHPNQSVVRREPGLAVARRTHTWVAMVVAGVTDVALPASAVQEVAVERVALEVGSTAELVCRRALRARRSCTALVEVARTGMDLARITARQVLRRVEVVVLA